MQAILCPFLGCGRLDHRIFAQAEFTVPENSVSSPEGSGPSADTQFSTIPAFFLSEGQALWPPGNC